MPTMPEWIRKYGVESARKQFRFGDHIVFVVRPGRNVFATCGEWKASQPLGIDPDVEKAKAALREACGYCFLTEETIVEEEDGDQG